MIILLDKIKVFSHNYYIDCHENYGGPVEQGLTAGIGYFLSYQMTFFIRIMNLEFSDDVKEELLESEEITFLGSRLIVYLQPALEQQMVEYETDLNNYIGLLAFFTWLKACCYIVVFSLLFIFIFLGLIKKLTLEILLNRGMLNIIPKFILEKNTAVQEHLLKQKTIA